MTKPAPEWVRTSDPVVRSPARYRWTTAPTPNGDEIPGDRCITDAIRDAYNKSQTKQPHYSRQTNQSLIHKYIPKSGKLCNVYEWVKS